MQWKNQNTPDTSSITDRASSSNKQQTCPLLNVVGASEHGVVLESRRDFDIGSALSIGFHVDSCLRGNTTDRDSSFISAEFIVVECRPKVASDGCLVYRLTLMFSDISNRDRYLLVKASEDGFSSLQSDNSSPLGLN